MSRPAVQAPSVSIARIGSVDSVASIARDLSLAWQTDLAFARFDGSVADRGDHLCVRTPTNPTYWWGNFPLFDAPPREGDLARWMALFEDEIEAPQPASRHRAFGVDTRERVVLPPEFAAAGFTLAQSTVLTLTRAQLRPLARVTPPLARVTPAQAGVTPAQACVTRAQAQALARVTPAQARVRVLDLRSDAAAVVDKHVAVDAHRYEPVGYRVFAQRQMERYAAMQAAGRGHWFGIELPADGAPVLAASCGLFRDPALGDGLGRFQYVSTHPDWRRRGLCRALVHAACRHGFEQMGLRTLVMAADPADVAIGLYESLGFRRGVSAWQIERPPLTPDAAES